MSTDVITLDFETTINVQGDPSARDLRNNVVAEGYKWLTNDHVKTVDDSVTTEQTCFIPSLKDAKVIVGQNLSFDLAYVKRNAPDLWDHILRNTSLWDIQLAEYLITGQQAKMSSLDQMSAKYGGTAKSSVVTDMFKLGVVPPFSVLQPYLIEDVKNTELIFLKQFKAVTDLGIMPLVRSQMDALLACIEATTNGLGLHANMIDLNNTFVEKEIELAVNAMLRTFPGITEPIINSPKQLGTYLFGGTVKKKEKVLVGKYKNGNDKFATQELEVKVPGLALDVTRSMYGKRTASGAWSVDEPSLAPMALLSGPCRTADPTMFHFVEILLHIRNLQKIQGTYLKNLKEYCDRYVLYGHSVTKVPVVNHRLNQTSTDTGRLSSSDPNLQNVSGDKLVKECFIPKITNGKLVEIDFEQLEIIGLALYTQDKQLLYDVANGVDIHTALYHDLYGRLPSKDERKAFKRLTFATVYGAGVSGLAEQGGIDKHTAKKFLLRFYGRYPEVGKWHTQLEYEGVTKAHVVSLPTEVAGVTSAGHSIHRYRGQSYLTNRILSYTDKEVGWKSEPSVSPTILKNYPIQSLATGDIVPMMLGYMIRRLAESEVWSDRNKCQFINTVHDSLMFEVLTSHVEEFMNFISEVLSKTAPVFVNTFNPDKDICIPSFNLKISVGSDWFNMVEVRNITGEKAYGYSDGSS